MATAKRDLTNPPVQGPVLAGSALLLPVEAAELLRVSIDQLYHLTSRKQIPFLKVGAALRFNRQRLLEFVASEPQSKDAAVRPAGSRKAASRGSNGSRSEPRRSGRFSFRTPPRGTGDAEK